jgi:hypothetical protein
MKSVSDKLPFPSPAAGAQHRLADQVTLKNGDRRSGVIVKSEAKELTLKSEFAGTVKIQWDAVDAITATAPLYVHLTSGDTLSGTVSTSQDAGRALSRRQPCHLCRLGRLKRQRGPKIAQRLRSHPVLAIPAVQIAPQHAEAERARSGQSVKERFLLDRIALQRPDVSPGHIKLAAPIEPHLANPGESSGNRAAMSAGVATDPVAFERLIKLAHAHARIQLFRQGAHSLFCQASGLRHVGMALAVLCMPYNYQGHTGNGGS